MAEGKITITILGEGGKGKDKEIEDKTPDPGKSVYSTLNKILHPLKTVEGAINTNVIQPMGKGAVAAVGIGAKVVSDALSTAYSLAMSEHNRYFTLTEDYLAQNKMNAIQTSINTTKSFLSSAASGAMAGAAAGLAGGPAGVVIGALIGGATSIVKTGIEAENAKNAKIEQYNMQLNATNAQTNFMASRASLVNGGRGTEN